jgi:hypothetical protein
MPKKVWKYFNMSDIPFAIYIGYLGIFVIDFQTYKTYNDPWVSITIYILIWILVYIYYLYTHQASSKKGKSAKDRGNPGGGWDSFKPGSVAAPNVKTPKETIITPTDKKRPKSDNNGDKGENSKPNRAASFEPKKKSPDIEITNPGKSSTNKPPASHQPNETDKSIAISYKVNERFLEGTRKGKYPIVVPPLFRSQFIELKKQKEGVVQGVY